jgi:endonuclease/exonuclease/phosphatase family metal-dependent hydrolase
VERDGRRGREAADVREGRFTAMSVNLWNTQRLPAREAPLRRLLARSPDVLAVQELRPQLAAVITDVLPHHERVVGEERGWTHEGNVWWDTTVFRRLGHGASPFGALERDRRVFWVRLEHLVSGRMLVVASVHLTWLGGSDELETGVNPRLAQTRAVAQVLHDVAEDAPCLVMGDLNDAVVPPRVLRAAGFEDAWSALGVTPGATFPAFPLSTEGSRRPPLLPASTLDWQFHRGAVRPEMTETIDQPYRGIAPSDHRALMTLYALGDPAASAASSSTA